LLCGLLAVALVSPTAAAGDNPIPKIEFDKEAGQNPSSPAEGQIKVTGTYKLEKGFTFDKVRVRYRKVGTDTWTFAREKAVKVAAKDGKPTWEVLIDENRPPPAPGRCPESRCQGR
jgi:hypothetical protein